MGRYFGLRGQALNWAIGAIAGCDFLLFGYGAASDPPPPPPPRHLTADRVQTKASWAVS